MKDINYDKSNNKLRVGIYLRLSNEDRDKVSKEDMSESIKNQRNMLIEYIDKHSEFVLVDEYCDEDLSGAGTYRPEFERLIRDCENKKIDVVLVKSQSRFSRDMEIVERYINNKFKEWNIRFIGLCDNADTYNVGNKKSRQINGLVNEWYLEDVSNNIRSAFNSKMKQGEFISPFAVFGYEVSSVDNNKLVVDIVASKIVKDIFNLYLTGFGYTGIANYLNNKNIPSPSLYKYRKGIKLNVVSNRSREEIKWSGNAIKKILTNEIYLGHLVQGKRTTISYKNHKIRRKNKDEWIKVLNTHEAIIDEETFNKVQLAIKKRTKPIKKTNKVHVFSGKVFCNLCNHYMRKKNSKRHEYLVCSSSCNGYDECVNKSSIRYDVLDKIVLERINKMVWKYYDEEMLCNFKDKRNDRRYLTRLEYLERQKVELEKEILKNKNYIKNLYEDKVNGIINVDQFEFLIKEYDKNDEFYCKQMKEVSKEIEDLKNKDEEFIDNKNVFKKYKEFIVLNRIIIDEFIDKIYVDKIENNSRKIFIKWKL